MKKTPRILAFAGSARPESFNKRLVQVAMRGAQAAGAEVHYIDLRDFPMPLYDAELEAGEGLPRTAADLKKLMIEHDGFLISCPEYNSSITPLLKNTIDWVSRPVGQEPPLTAFKGKGAVLMSASPGAWGGLRGLVHVRAILSNIGVIVLPDQIAIAKAHEAFAPNGSLRDAVQHAQVEGLGQTLASFLEKIRA